MIESTRDMPYPIVQAMPYRVVLDFDSGRIRIYGRRGWLLQVYTSDYRGRALRPTRQQIETWAWNADVSAVWADGRQLVTFWFFSSAGRSMVEYLEALQSFGKYLLQGWDTVNDPTT